LSSRLDGLGASARQLILSTDGSYTNGTILKGLPSGVTLIGRVRKDATLNFLPETEKTKGRTRKYGAPAPTPEQIRQSDDYPWQDVTGWAAGKKHTFNVKVIKSLKWRTAGQAHTFQMVVIRPLSYRLKKGGRLLYRKPAYLVCCDNGLDIETLLQSYLWRWEIEVNFKRLKQNFELGYFYSDSQEGIKTQIWIALIANLLFTVIHKQCREAEIFTTIVNLAAVNMGSYISLIKIVNSGRLSPEDRDLGIVQLKIFENIRGGLFRKPEKSP
jgi:hypothetical protein